MKSVQGGLRCLVAARSVAARSFNFLGGEDERKRGSCSLKLWANIELDLVFVFFKNIINVTQV
jgi:hypothetical protein